MNLMGDPWWLAKEPHKVLAPYLAELEKKSRLRTCLDYFHRSVYEARPFRSISASASMDFARHLNQAKPRINAVKSAVDTHVNRLMKRRALAMLTPTGADWSLKNRAKKTSQYIRSKQSSAEADALYPQLLFDGDIVGTGCYETVETDRGDVGFERVPRDEILLEPRELKYNSPRQIHRKMQMSRHVLWNKFPSKAARNAIANAPKCDRDFDRIMGYVGDSDSNDDQIDVWKSWRLPSTCDSEDGRHCVTIVGFTLFDEEWHEDVFPISFFHTERPASGFWGRGLVETNTGLQVGIDFLFRAMLENAAATAGLHIMLRRGSDVPKSSFGGSPVPRITEFDGPVPPQFVAPSPFSPAQMQLLQFLIQQVFEMSGMSQASAASKSPLGNDVSGAAIDNMMDIESDRFGVNELDYGILRLDGAKAIVAVNKQAARREPGRKISWQDGDLLHSIDWNKVDMERDQFAYKLEATNFIPETRAGKFSMLDTLLKSNVITNKSQLMSLFDEPDMQRLFSMENSKSNAIMKVLEQAGDTDKPAPFIDPNMDAADLFDTSVKFINYLIANEAPEEVMTRVRDVIGYAKALVDKAAAPPPSAPPAPPMGAPPPPMPPGPMGPAGPQGMPGLAAGAMPDPTQMMPQQGAAQ